MKKILVLSDVHGDRIKMNTILEKEKYDHVVFCGDGLGDIYSSVVKNLTVVCGNTDMNCSAKDEILTGIFQKMVFVVHGHNYGVKSSLNKLVIEAKSNYADIVLFGHTHQQVSKSISGIHFMNPGACKDGYYGIVEIDAEIKMVLKKLN